MFIKYLRNTSFCVEDERRRVRSDKMKMNFQLIKLLVPFFLLSMFPHLISETTTTYRFDISEDFETTIFCVFTVLLCIVECVTK